METHCQSRLEALFRFLVAEVEIRVQLLCKAAVDFLDVFRRGRASYTQNFIRIFHCPSNTLALTCLDRILEPVRYFS